MKSAKLEKSEKRYCLFCYKEIRPMVYFCSLKCELLHTKILNNRNEIKRKNLLKKV
jgi:predicted nucleic acid-binding Zn ribbon protein